jgi:predicted transglutaminase-like cysteine proteinase
LRSPARVGEPLAGLETTFTPAVRPESLPIGKRTVAPFGAVVLCQHAPASCAVLAARGVAVVDDKVVLTPELAKRVAVVNAIVNRQMKPKIDHAWHVGGASGDCKDYALTKRSLLNNMGFPTSSTLVAIVTEPRGRLHAVLILRTDQGDLVLDNLVTDMRQWWSTTYTWEKIQSPADPAIWLTIPRVSLADLH